MSAGPPPRLTVDVRGRLGTQTLDLQLDAPLAGVSVINGPSGAGKTTLLRCIAGLTRLEGQVTVAGTIWQDGPQFVPPHRRAVGYVFQDARLFSHLSVSGNLTFGTRRTEPGGTASDLTLDEVAQRLNLAPLLHRSIGALSGGERQRVAIGRALLSQPRLLLMDEPTASLDVEARGEVIRLIDQLARDLSTPVLLVSHDPGSVAHLAQRRISVAAGRIVSVTEVDGGDRDPIAGLSDPARDALARAAVLAGLAPLDRRP
jgi:molybdate transport system ATP-binding protein